MLKKILALAFLAVLLTGCKATFTNLTPTRQVRNETGYYPVEVSLNTRQATIRWDTMEPKIVVGEELIPMRPTPLMKNRWEGFVPVASGASSTTYKYRFDYQYNDFGGPKPDSLMSPEYELQILDE